MLAYDHHTDASFLVWKRWFGAGLRRTLAAFERLERRQFDAPWRGPIGRRPTCG